MKNRLAVVVLCLCFGAAEAAINPRARELGIPFDGVPAAANQVTGFEARALANAQLDPLFLATVQAVEESITNAMVAAETMTGRNGVTVPAIDPAELKKILRRFDRLQR